MNYFNRDRADSFYTEQEPARKTPPCPDCGKGAMYQPEPGKLDWWCKNCDAGPYKLTKE